MPSSPSGLPFGGCHFGWPFKDFAMSNVPESELRQNKPCTTVRVYIILTYQSNRHTLWAQEEAEQLQLLPQTLQRLQISQLQPEWRNNLKCLIHSVPLTKFRPWCATQNRFLFQALWTRQRRSTSKTGSCFDFSGGLVICNELDWGKRYIPPLSAVKCHVVVYVV